VIKRRLTEEASNWLIRLASASEVKRVVFQFSPDKALEADGSNAHFFQKHWSIVGKNTTLAIQFFFQNCKLFSEVKPRPSDISTKIQSEHALYQIQANVML